MKKVISYYLFALLSQGINAQSELKPQKLSLNNIRPKSEFSALAWKGNETLFMLAQRNDTAFFYALRQEVQQALDNKHGSLQLHSIPVFGLKDFKNRINDTYKDSGAFDGLEACTIIGDSIYVSVETNRDTCFILKGVVSKDKIIFSPDDYLPIPKPYNASNYGYENLIHLGNNMLLTIFETAENDINHYTFTFNSSLGDTNSTVKANCDYRNPDGRELRLADICRYDDTVFYAIDFTLRKDKKDIKEPCFSKLVKLDIKPKNIQVTYVGNLLYGSDKCNKRKINCINFEGIVQFGKGILVISDDDISDDNCTHLYYYKLE